jgi:AraC-like DNA-binding protein
MSTQTTQHTQARRATLDDTRAWGLSVEPGVPFAARSRVLRRMVTSSAVDWMQIVVIRQGTARVIHGDDGHEAFAGPGMAVFLMPNEPLGLEPEGQVTVTQVFFSVDYMLDQVRWRNPYTCVDRFAAQRMVMLVHPEPHQVVRLNPEHLGIMDGCLDGLVDLTVKLRLREQFYEASSRALGVLAVVSERLARRGELAAWEVPGDLTTRASQACFSVVRPLREEVRVARRLIRAHYQEQLTISELAQAVHMSPSALRVAFTGEMGKTLLAYRNSIRVAHMVKLLVETPLPIKVISRTVGWADPAQATEVFTDATELTPKVYRARFHSVVEGEDWVDRVLKVADLFVFDQ